jgi:cathepsin D
MFPCHTVLPDIAFYFDGVAFPITQSFNRGKRLSGSYKCLGGIVGNEVTNVWNLGTAFMANYYTVFDFGRKKVGFATLAAA